MTSTPIRYVALTALLLVSTGLAVAQVPAIPFLDDSTVQTINLTMDPNDWAALQQNYQDNTYYHATFTWNAISEGIGIRSHGGGSRSPVKPNLDLNFAKYTKSQTFLGLPFILIKANNEDPSNLREWLSMKLYRKMGIPAPREAPAQVYINGQLLGFYYIVEHLDETFLQRNYGESGGYLYQWESTDNYDFENLGANPSLYAAFLDLKTSQPTPDLQTFVNLVEVINQPSSPTFTGDAFIAAVSQYVDPKQFLLYGATEQALAGSDSLIGGQQGMNNFYLYQFQGTTQYNFIPWDKDFTFSDTNRDIMDGISNGPNINLLAQRLAAIPAYAQVYLNALFKAATLMAGTGGWADQEISREYAVIQAAATNDPNKQCLNAGVLFPCGNQDFETEVQYLHSFLSSRSDFVQAQTVSGGYQPSAAGPQLTAQTIASYGGAPALSPGGLATLAGANLSISTGANVVSITGLGSGAALPRVLGSTFVAVEGVRAPLVVTESGSILFQAPGDIPTGTASVVVSVNGDTSATADVTVQASAPAILAVNHLDGLPVSAIDPVSAGETLVVFATGLGAVSGALPIGYAAPDASSTTLGAPQVMLGGLPVLVTYSGLAPDSVGIYQVNVTVPPDMASVTSAPAITLTAGGLTVLWPPN